MFTSNNQHITNKQYKVLTVICTGNTGQDGSFEPVDIDELVERVAYRTTKQSMQFSIRALVNRGLITKDYDTRRGAKRVVYNPTRECRAMMQFSDPGYITADYSHIDI